MVRYFLGLLLWWLLVGCANSGGSKAIKVNQNNVDLIRQLKAYPKDAIPPQKIKDEHLAFPAEGTINPYGLKVTPALAIAYENYLGGDGERALKALETVVQNSTDNRVRWYASLLKMKIYLMMGLYQEAIHEAPSAMEYEQKSFGSHLNSLAHRGESYVWAGEYQKAKRDLSEVLLRLGDWELPTSYLMPPSDMPKLIAKTTAQLRAYTALAAMYLLQDDYKRAYYFANEADKRYNALFFVANHWLYGKFFKLHLDTYYGYATNQTFLGATLLALGDSQHANQAFGQALEFFDRIGYQKGQVTALSLKAYILNKIGQFPAANKVAKRALQAAKKGGFIDFIWRVEAVRGETLEKMGQDQAAEVAYRQALEGINLLSRRLIHESTKRHFSLNKDDIALALIRFDLKKNDLKQLFTDLEESRARAFVEMLALRTIEQENPELKQIYDLDQAIDRQHLLNQKEGASSQEGVKELERLLDERKQRVIKLQRIDPRSASVVSVWSSSLSVVQQALADKRLIYFLPKVAEDRIEYLEISSNSIDLKRLDMGYQDLKELLQGVAELLGVKQIPSRGVKLQIQRGESLVPKKEALETLNQLFKPLNQSGITYIVPSDESNFIPWGALDIGFTPLVLPTASWLNLEHLSLPSTHAVVVGDPDFGGEVMQLKGAREEAKEVAEYYHTQPLLGRDATKANVREALGKGGALLHLATHGVFEKDHPLQSAILLSRGSGVDRLTVGEIFESPLPANLVVLSACESGLGSYAGANDYVGLTRSFFLGGTKAVLASLWEIEDEGTKAFMRIFYRYAQQGDYAKGYQMATSQLKAQGYAPRVYGAFILYGLGRVP